ncbi:MULTISPECIES: ABC transporter ATP-binding protein [unclassified Arthrobacter]|uniref:ABC transporter ATP-binding protein n=1 Tax=unclassified Arthrobacter TaxID=235627 RepID=UPI002E05FD7A|nr:MULTISPECIES: ABC transporter ATP-binding protein [unclassified Arthrobacter]MEC5190919.1 ATP-binding cassette subfamily B multidrug efflux pump [Arthrobacter sp. MP_M4]MEC5202063.1 ATP-binding cassette subfamily B multidrug efflux pump [Arthrobacter sp. MP_M7]
MLIGLTGRLLAAHKGAVLAIVALQLIQTMATLLLPTLNAAIIDNGIVGGDVPQIVNLGSWMAVTAGVQVVAAVAAGYLGAVVAMELGRTLREELFATVQSMSSQEVNAFGAASLVTRVTNDVTQVQNLVVLVFTMLVAAPAIFVGGIALAVHQDVVLSGIVIAVVPVLAVIMVLIVRRLIPLYRQGQELIDRISRVLREQIIGASVIRGFGRQGHEERRFDGANKELTDNNLRSALLVAGMMPMIMLVVNLSSVGVVWFGGHRIQSGDMRLGALTAFIAYILQILIAIMMAMYVFMTAPRAAACAERIQAVLDTTPAVTDGPGVGGPGGNAVEYRNVSFAYPGAEQPVLDGVTFTAAPGTVTAIIGATGTGKSTLLNLLPRFLDASGGAVSIGGCDVRSLSLPALRSLVAVVPQHSYLFSGTIAGNLRMAAPAATDADLWRVLGSAQAEEFVRKSPQGLRAPVSQGGTNFSGGQRQRLCIARALLREADVYLFDDSFSALDYGTDYRLREALRSLLRTATVLVVAERVATIMDADLILVLEDGRVVAQGTHRQLMTSSPSYQEIAASQLVLEETP